MEGLKPSAYARLTVMRSPESVMRELDRLQAKLAIYNKALRHIAMGGGPQGKRASDGIEEAMAI